MRIVCDVGLDDIIAFNQFYQNNSALGARVRRTQRVAFLVIICVMMGLAWQFLRETFLWIGIFGGVAGLAAFVQLGRKSTLAQQVAKNVRVIYQDPAMSATLGRKVLEIEGPWLVQSSEIFQTRAKISSLHSIHVESGRVFIRMNPVSAIIVPWNKVGEGDPIAFLDALQAQCPEHLKVAIPQGVAGLTDSGNPYRSPGA